MWWPAGVFLIHASIATAAQQTGRIPVTASTGRTQAAGGATTSQAVPGTSGPAFIPLSEMQSPTSPTVNMDSPSGGKQSPNSANGVSAFMRVNEKGKSEIVQLDEDGNPVSATPAE
jgi:hypothetical protein